MTPDSPDDDARPLTPAEQRRLDALDCGQAHDDPDLARTHRARSDVGVAVSAACVLVGLAAVVLGLGAAVLLGAFAVPTVGLCAASWLRR